MHASDALCYIGENLQDLRLSQPILQPSIHKIDQAASSTKFHEKKHLIATTLELGSVRIEIGDNMPVASQLFHRLDLGPHVRQSDFVRDGHSLQHGRFNSIDGLREPNDVDV